MTKEDAVALKAIDEKVNKLVDSSPEDSSNADYEKLDKQIDELYKTLNK